MSSHPPAVPPHYGGCALHRKRMTMGNRCQVCAVRRFFFLVMIGVIFSGLSFTRPRVADAASVLLLNAYHKGLAWTDAITSGVESVLSDHTIYVEYMDTKRHWDDRYLSQLRDLLITKYRTIRPDVVISSDDHALSFLLDNRDRLFPGIPIVFCGVNDYRESLLAGHDRVTGVVEAFDIRQTIDEALRLHPSAEKMVIINDDTKTGQANKRVIMRLLPEFADRVAFEFWERLSMQALLDRVGQLPSRTVVLLMSFNRDAAGNVYDYATSIERIAGKCKVPIYGVWDFYLGKGIVGGKLTSGRSQGETAALIALEIIDGARADEIPVVTESPNRWMFDARQLERFNIDDSSLPPGSDIINRPPSIYAEYKAVIWSTVVAVFALATLSLFLMANIQKRKRVETNLRKSERQMAQIINFLPDPTFVIDRKSRVIAWNRAMEALTGIAAADILGKGDYEYAVPFYGERRPVMIDLVGAWNDIVADTYRDVQRQGDRLISETLNPHRPLGNRHFRNTAGPLYDQHGNFAGAIETIHDITERRAAETAVKELHAATRKNLAFIEALLSAVPTPVFYKDLKGRYLGCNQAFSDLMGVTAEKIQGKTVLELWRSEKADSYHRRDLELIRTPGRQTFEYKVRDKDGRDRDVIYAKDTFYDENGDAAGIVGSFTDITELRHAEANLRLMEHVVQNSPVVLFRWKAEEDWPVAYVSENVRQFGYTAQDLISGRVRFAAMVHPHDLDRVVEEVRAHSLEGGDHFQQEYRIITRSGDVRWVDDRTLIERNDDGAITHYQGVVLDITDRKTAQLEIVQRQQFLESVLYHAPDAIIVLDDDHRVLDWNPGAEKTFGYRRHEVLGRELDSLVARGAAREEAGHKTRSVLSGTRVEAFETVRYRKDGSPVNVIAGGSPIMIDGSLRGVVAMYTDITALKLAEQESRRKERMLRRIMDIVPSMIFVRNAEGRFLMVNQAVADSYSMTTAELVGMHQEKVHPDPEQARRFLADDRKALATGRPLFIASEPYQDSSGATRWLEVIKMPCDEADFGEPAVVGLATDITERRTVEARIQESEKRYRTIFENTGTGTVISEADTILSMVNGEFAAMVGYSRKEIEGRMSWTRFIVPEDVERMKTYHYNRRKDPSSAPTQWECGLMDRQGNVKRMLLKVRLIPGTQTSVGAFLDISDRKRAEEAMRKANRMLRLVLDTIPVRVFWKDRESRYLGCNQPFAEDAARSHPDDLIGKDDFAMTWIDQAKLYREDDRRVMATGDARINYEEPQTTPDGRTIWLQTSKVPMRDGQGNIIGILGTYQDITERKTAVEEMRRLRNYLANIINSMPSILVGVDGDGRVTQWNKQAELSTGMSFESVRSRPLTTVFPRLHDEMERIMTAIKDRRVIRDPKIARQSGGETRFEDITIFPLVANGVEGAVIRVDDVTERVRLEEMMIQSEKMLSVGGLAAGMAHEINNPLAGILQNAAVMDNRLFGDLQANHDAAEAAGTTLAAIQRFLEIRRLPAMVDNIRMSGNRAAAIVKNMLSFARKSDRIVSSHDLATLLDQTLELAQTDYDMKKRYDFKKIAIVREYDAAAVPVPCEAGKIQQVFLNILKNGAEAMAEATESPTQPVFRLGVAPEGPWVRVTIEDNGPGLDEETRRRIFEPFFTTKPVGEGTGLGLSVSYFIITENHGGKMTAQAAEGGGTRFVIRLPLKGK